MGSVSCRNNQIMVRATVIQTKGNFTTKMARLILVQIDGYWYIGTGKKDLFQEREFVLENERGGDIAMTIDCNVVLSDGQEEKTMVI